MAKRRRTTSAGGKVEKSGRGAPNNGGEGRAAPPRDVGPSPAWERLKRKKTVVREPGAMFAGRNDVLQKCVCWEPWVGGHRYDCPLWQKVCEECGFHNGLHRWDCRWWTEHAGATPFDGKSWNDKANKRATKEAP